MMRITTAFTASVLFALMPNIAFADQTRFHQNDDMMRHNVSNRMFDGVSLTEHQRQQMRDLVRQARCDLTGVDYIYDANVMHKLVTAETFDAPAVRAQAEKMARENVERQVELARIRNQMYKLLTPEQKDQINVRYQQRVEQLQYHTAQLQNASSLKLSTTK